MLARLALAALSLVSARPGTIDEPTPTPTPTPVEAAAADDSTEDLDPTKLVVFQLRLQHDELGDGNAVDLALLRRDVAVRRPRSWPKAGERLALLRFDLPVGQVRLGGESEAGLGDLYWQALNVRPIGPRLKLASGLAFQLPTATEDTLGTGKWVAAPTLIPVWNLPVRSLFFAKFQEYVSFAGDDDRRDINYLSVNPVYIRLLRNQKFLLVDTEGIADWQRNGQISWKSGLLIGTALRHQRALWVKLEVPWGEHRRGEWALRASIAFRGRR